MLDRSCGLYHEKYHPDATSHTTVCLPISNDLASTDILSATRDKVVSNKRNVWLLFWPAITKKNTSCKKKTTRETVHQKLCTVLFITESHCLHQCSANIPGYHSTQKSAAAKLRNIVQPSRSIWHSLKTHTRRIWPEVQCMVIIMIMSISGSNHSNVGWMDG